MHVITVAPCDPLPAGAADTEVVMHPALSPTPIIDLAVAFWGAKTLLSAVELDLFTTLAAGPLDREALMARLHLHPRAARDFLDALVALGMLTRTGATYANTPETDAFLVRGKPEYVGDYLDMLNTRLYPFWGASPRPCARASRKTRRNTGAISSGRSMGRRSACAALCSP
jgi:hypothetical protein